MANTNYDVDYIYRVRPAEVERRVSDGLDQLQLCHTVSYALTR